MVLFILSICILLACALAWGKFYQTNTKEHNQADKDKEEEISGCALAGICGKNCTIEPKQKAEYFEDEELDTYKGRRASDYTDEETEQFREIRDTMQREEVPDWLKSLQQRGVALPETMKEETFHLVEEQCAPKDKKKC